MFPNVGYYAYDILVKGGPPRLEEPDRQHTELDEMVNLPIPFLNPYYQAYYDI